MSGSGQVDRLQISGQRIISLDEAARSDLCARMLEYWRSSGAANASGVPRRKDIDPLDLADFLPYLGVLDVLGDRPPYEFRIRLQGTALVQAIGEFTGHLVSETPLAVRDMSHFDEAVTRRAPRCAEGVLWFFGKDHVAYRELCLPLEGSVGAVDKLMICVDLNGFPGRSRAAVGEDCLPAGLYRRQ